MNRAMIFLKNLYKNNRLSWNEGPSKNRILQSYDVLWIHVIDVSVRYVCTKRIFVCLLFRLQETLNKN